MVADFGIEDYRLGDLIELRQGDIAHSEGFGFAFEKGSLVKVLLMERSEIAEFKQRSLEHLRKEVELLDKGAALVVADRPSALAKKAKGDEEEADDDGRTGGLRRAGQEVQALQKVHLGDDAGALGLP